MNVAVMIRYQASIGGDRAKMLMKAKTYLTKPITIAYFLLRPGCSGVGGYIHQPGVMVR